ncbi:MAG TPA: hypothetical protein VJ852_06820 [Gemmatimonadaceae bacterium]|nr:hypothetical protein [Gemmatimonadaceae bacterium]
MSRNFTVTGAEALLAIAACERITSLNGQTEMRPGQNVTFAYGAVGRLLPFDTPGAPGSNSDDPDLSVEVERLMTKPGVYRYQCTIQPNVNGVLN